MQMQFLIAEFPSSWMRWEMAINWQATSIVESKFDDRPGNFQNGYGCELLFAWKCFWTMKCTKSSPFHLEYQMQVLHLLDQRFYIYFDSGNNFISVMFGESGSFKDWKNRWMGSLSRAQIKVSISNYPKWFYANRKDQRQPFLFYYQQPGITCRKSIFQYVLFLFKSKCTNSKIF